MSAPTRSEIEMFMEPALFSDSQSFNPYCGNSDYYQSLVERYSENAVKKAIAEYDNRANVALDTLEDL